jgi:hypothetical protein
MSFDPEHLELLKRRAEEDFMLDMAAIERLERRLGTTSYAAASPAPAPMPSIFEALPTASQPDELGNSLRAMFSSAR